MKADVNTVSLALNILHCFDIYFHYFA